MARESEPVILELASLPREQVGPFLLLGLDKRLKLGRKQLLKVPLEDINWARKLLEDAGRWVQADAASLNSDTGDGFLADLARRQGLVHGRAGLQWQALDKEPALADHVPAADLPDPEAVRASLAVPDVPGDLPAVLSLLEQLAQQGLDPWQLDLPRP
jgi:hypothetical protein